MTQISSPNRWHLRVSELYIQVARALLVRDIDIISHSKASDFFQIANMLVYLSDMNRWIVPY